MILRNLAALALMLFALTVPPMAHAADSEAQLSEKDVLDYLDQSIVWYRHIATTETANVSSREMLLRNSLQQSAFKVVRGGFDFARAQSDQLQEQKDAMAAVAKKDAIDDAKVPAVDDKIEKFNPATAKITIDQKITDLQNQIADTDAALPHTPHAQRAIVQAKRDKLGAELGLAQTQQNLIETVLEMSSSEQEESLSGQIDNLAKAIPELSAQVKKKTDAPVANDNPVPNAIQLLTPELSATTDAPAAPAEDTANESKGVIGLIGDLIAHSRQRQDLADLQDETTTLQKTNDDKIEQQRGRLLEIVKRSKDLSQKTESAATDTLLQSQELTALNNDFKTVSDYIVPLSKQRIALRNAAQTLTSWQGLFADEMSQIARRLLTRLITLIILIAVPFVLSELVRRGLSQYVHDSRRRRQLNIMRRVIVGFLVGLIILLNMVSEFSSFATFIGFMTAGMAVALQNVILSTVAYFFFFGRFGIKNGSRVTAGGVTGDVIETGFVRLYLMELTDEKGSMRPTGRIVAFPNSIIFQPAAFFKQVPGVNYRWHEITYTLEPDTERSLAETKLREIVDSVYKDSKSMIDMQKAAMEQSTRLRVKEPRPDGKIEKTVDGLNVTIRYPVDTEAAETTDKNVMRQVGEIFERLPSVKSISDEPPVIKRK